MNRQLTNIALVILTLILFAAGVLKILQEYQESLDSDYDVIYVYDTYEFYIFAVIISVSTLGFNNFYSGAIIKLFLVFLIFISLATIPAKTSQLISIFSSKSVYARKK